MSCTKINREYLGLVPDVSTSKWVVKNNYQEYKFQANSIIWNKIKCYTCAVSVDFYQYYFLLEEVLNVLKEFSYNNENHIARYKYSVDSMGEMICELNDYIFVNIGSILYMHDFKSEQNKIDIKKNNQPVQVFKRMKIFYLPEYEHTVKCILDKINGYKVEKTIAKSINLICYVYDEEEDEQVLVLEPIEIKIPKINNFQLHYGEEFMKTHETIMNALNKKDSSGLILLHGISGSGKTHYIRYLIHNIEAKMFIYLPPDMVEKLSDPEFYSYLLQQENSILIIEDAENIIKSRSGDDDSARTQTVANLLNLTDGLLGDSLHQIVIATFNCELSSIDTALLRKGRLIAIHEFRKLSIDNSQKLSNELGFSSIITEPMTLADIYCQNK